MCQLWVASGPQRTIPVCSARNGFSDLLGSHFTKYQRDSGNFFNRCTRDTFHLATGKGPRLT